MLLWWGVYSAAEKHCTLHCWSLPFCTPLHRSESFLHLCKMRCVQDVWEVFRDWHHKIYIIKYNIIWLYINYTTHPTNTWHVSPFELTLEDSNTFSRLHALLEGLVQDLPHLGHPDHFGHPCVQTSKERKEELPVIRARQFKWLRSLLQQAMLSLARNCQMLKVLWEAMSCPARTLASSRTLNQQTLHNLFVNVLAHPEWRGKYVPVLYSLDLKYIWWYQSLDFFSNIIRSTARYDTFLHHSAPYT